MIVVEVNDNNHFRIAEANDLNPNGSPATTETGVVSNTRIQTLDDPALAAGWFRQHGTRGSDADAPSSRFGDRERHQARNRSARWCNVACSGLGQGH